MTEVFTDHLSVTTPMDDWAAMRESVSPLFDSIGAGVEFDTDSETLWRAGTGTCRAKRYGMVMMLSATGSFLAGLRVKAILDEYLATLGQHRHSVTRLDASLDLPVDASPVIAALVAKVSSDEGLRITRKRVRPDDCTRFVHVRADGQDTGTAYLGPKDADVRPCIYDKRQERLDKGLCDVGPLTRFECRIRKGMGPSLHDASRPTAIFWRFMGDVLPRPANAPVWSPAEVGFVLPARVGLNATERLLRRLEFSADLRDMLKLAHEVGPYGLSFFQSQVAKLYSEHSPAVARVA